MTTKSSFDEFFFLGGGKPRAMKCMCGKPHVFRRDKPVPPPGCLSAVYPRIIEAAAPGSISPLPLLRAFDSHVLPPYLADSGRSFRERGEPGQPLEAGKAINCIFFFRGWGVSVS